MRNKKEKPVSARSNNLEIWLSKRKALHKSHKGSDLNLNVISDADEACKQDENSKIDDKQNEVSYLSKLQCSLFFEPGAKFEDEG